MCREVGGGDALVWGIRKSMAVRGGGQRRDIICRSYCTGGEGGHTSWIRWLGVRTDFAEGGWGTSRIDSRDMRG